MVNLIKEASGIRVGDPRRPPGDSKSRAQFGRTPRAVRQPLQDVVRHLVTALFQKPSCFVLLLIIDLTTLPQRVDNFDPKS